MGYEGHVVGNPDRAAPSCGRGRVDGAAARGAPRRRRRCRPAGGTGTYDLHDWADEVQAGSYLLMDTALRTARPAVPPGAVRRGDRGVDLALQGVGRRRRRPEGVRHGPRRTPRSTGHDVFFCSDEHTTFLARDGSLPAVGDRLRLVPAHVDPTVALHERMHVVDDDEVLDTWPVDLRNW